MLRRASATCCARARPALRPPPRGRLARGPRDRLSRRRNGRSRPWHRLRLEAAEPPKPAQAEAIAQAMEAVAQAASAARAAEAAASAAAARIAGLERTIEQLRSEARTSQEQSNQLRQRLAASEETSRWMLPLAAAVLVLGALAGWLGWRLSALQARAPRRLACPGHEPGDSGPVAGGAGFDRGLSATTSFVTVPAVGVAPAGALARGTPAWPPPAVAPVDPWGLPDLARTSRAAGHARRARRGQQQARRPGGTRRPRRRAARRRSS
ncbi:MAG: hypothetical protein U1F49_06040 [Rubrivivax sp.]